MLVDTLTSSGLSGAQPYVAGRMGRDGAGTVQDWRAEMAGVKAGDRAAFAAVFRHFAPRVKGFLMKSGASAAQAEDCAQDVMATVWNKAALYDPAKASVSTWVFTIARNRLIDLARRDRRPEPEMLEAETEPDQADVFAAAEESRLLVAALEDLPEKQRDLIRRAFWGDKTHGELAVETGLPLGTIKSRIRLALERLRARLGDS